MGGILRGSNVSALATRALYNFKSRFKPKSEHILSNYSLNSLSILILLISIPTSFLQHKAVGLFFGRYNKLMNHPFLIETTCPLVALAGARNGYIQLAPQVSGLQEVVTGYQALSDDLAQHLFPAAHAWARILELHGAEKVYWITLAEVVTHLHIHLYPRWVEDTLKGIPLFEQREQPELQPMWTPALINARVTWSEQYQVALIS